MHKMPVEPTEPYAPGTSFEFTADAFILCVINFSARSTKKHAVEEIKKAPFTWLHRRFNAFETVRSEI